MAAKFSAPMEWMEDVMESLSLAAITTDPSMIGQVLRELGNLVLDMPRMPSVIRRDKLYSTFSFRVVASISNTMENCAEDSGLSRMNGAYILLKKGANVSRKYNLVAVEIVLNASFFSHTEILRKIVPNGLQSSAYEVVGDVIHLNLNEEQEKYKKLIGEVIHFKTGKTVINKIREIDCMYRVYQSEILAGRSSLKTIHRENGVKFMLDLGEVYWCSRLQPERSRILGMVRKGEVICDPFCGVGPHVVPALKKGARALCNDLNPSAVKWLMKTLEINLLSCECVENMDAAEFLYKHKESRIDHLIINLPEHSIDYLRFVELFRDCWIHVFFFCKENQNPCELIKKKTNYVIMPEWLREVRKVSPSKSVFKLEVFSTNFLNSQNVLS